MKIKSISLNEALLFLLVILPIYQDSPFSLILGAAGYSVLMPMSLIGIVLCILIYSRIPYNPRTQELIRLGGWLFIISYVAIVIWLLSGHSIVITSELLPIKALKVCLQYFSYVAYVLLLIRYTRKVGTNCIGKYSFVSLVVIAVIGIVEKTQIPYAFKGIHYAGVFPYWRIRLLTTEASWTAMMIYIYSAIAIFWCLFYKMKVRLVITLSCSAILLLNTSSKTLIMAIAITLLVYVCITIKRLSKKKVIILLGCALGTVILAQWILPQLISSFDNDIKNYTSVATRAYTIAIGLLIGIVFPCGVGGAVYIGVLQEYLQRFLFIFSKFPIKFNLTEINSIIHSSTDAAVTVKSGLIQYNTQWGILGTLYFIVNLSRNLKSILNENIRYKEILAASFITACILITTAQNFSFEFWLLYSFIVCLNEQTERKSAKC